MHAWSYFQGHIFGFKLRKGLIGLIFRKMLHFASSSVAKASAGKLVNLVSGDLTLIEKNSTSLFYLLAAPVVTFTSLFFLFKLEGHVAFYCLILAILLAVLNFPNSSLLYKAR